MNLVDVRTGLKTRLLTIDGLRAIEYLSDSVSPPVALVGMPETYEFDNTMGRGSDRITIPILVIVGRYSERAAQQKLDAYASGSGASSVKAAVEGDRTLGGACMDLRVRELRNFGEVTINNTAYLNFEAVVDIIGAG